MAKHTSFWMFEEPLAIVSSVVENNIGKAEQSVFISSNVQPLFHPFLILLIARFISEEAVIVAFLIFY